MTTKLSFCSLSLLLILFITTTAQVPKELKKQYVQYDTIEAVKKWLASNAIPLHTVEAGNGFVDMQPLKKLVGGAHLVALGEATHGTREFFQLKHRMLEFLVSEMGFTVFGIEATMPEAFDINEYVLTGKGDPMKALAGLYFWVWNTEEVLDMIRWMRHYNEDPNHKKKVKFYGFDMQYPSRAARVTLEYLRKVDPLEADKMEKVIGPIVNPYTANDILNQSQENKESYSGSIKTIVQRFDERKQDYIRRTSVMDYTFAHQHAKIMAQNKTVRLGGRAEKVRDSFMAENIRWIFEHEGPGAKMVIWAHNVHVAKEQGWMGAHLQKMFGSDMVVFGLTFNRGSFQGRMGEVRVFNVEPAPVGSLDATLAAAGLQTAAINLHAIPKNSPVMEWFEKPRSIRYFDTLEVKVVPQIYDALFFIEKTSSARANEGGRRPKDQKLDSPSNLDFENGEPGKPPPHWVLPPGFFNFDFNIAISGDSPHSGNRCAMISREPGKHYGETFGSIKQTIDANAYQGKKIRMQVSIRTEVNGPGNQAYFWLYCMKGFNRLFVDKMSRQPITNSEWKDYDIVGEVPADAETIEYGLALVGDGKVWIDSISIVVIDK